MSTVAKVFVVLNLLLAVAFLGAAATLLGYADSYKKTLETERISSKSTIAEKDKLLAEAEAAKSTLTAQKNEASANAVKARTEADVRKSTNDQLVQDNNKLSAAYENATKALQVAQSTIKGSSDMVTQLQNERQQTLEKLKSAEEQATAAVKRSNQAELDLENAQAGLQDAQTKLASTQDELNRTKFKYDAVIQTNPALAGGSEQPAQKGKILAADNEHGIYVISLGSEDSVKVGFKYTVSRGSHYVGQIVVTGVEAKMANASGVAGMSNGPIQVNDDISNR